MTVVAFILGIALMVVGLAVSIALHEIGHLVPAKRFGVHVGQYMIGFGPTLWSRRYGETQYGIKAIPLGGYISMAGMYPPSPAEIAAKEQGADASTQRSGRAGGGFFATMVQDARLANDETLIAGRERVFYKLPVWKRVVIMLGGPLMNLLFAIVLFTILFSGIGVQTSSTTVAKLSECVLPAGTTQTACAASDPRTPAVQAGFQPGDRMVSIDGTPVSTFAEASALIQAAPGKTLDVVVVRGGSEMTLRLTPVLATRPVLDAQGAPTTGADGQPVTQDVGFAGIYPTSELMPQPIWAGPQAAIENVGAVFGIIGQLPVKVYDTAVSLFTGGARDPNGPLSVVGVGVIAGDVAASEAPVLNRIGGFLGLLASLNVALFAFNLIPLLPLDGGHVVVALWGGLKSAWAKLRRRPPPAPVDATKLVPVTFVVVVLLIVMGAILILADLINPISLFGP
ncbi:M50 family metallopeptidase [Microbacterium sp. CJ88]|uniref:M50 family metallopeptidase n=1 Tax=Microbacterium sp. CJ88 TaxID=3445672 RepID=UPI003F65E6C0